MTDKPDPTFERLQAAQTEYLAALQDVWAAIIKQYAECAEKAGGCAAPPSKPK